MLANYAHADWQGGINAVVNFSNPVLSSIESFCFDLSKARCLHLFNDSS